MTVNSEQVYSSYNFLISQTEYGFSFSVNDITLDENNVIVFLSKTDYPSDEDEIVLVLGTDYTIAFEPSGVGGLVTLIDPSALPADFEYLIILRSIPYEQPTSYPEYYDQTTEEYVADNLERQIQQNRSSIESNKEIIEKNKIKINPPNEAGRYIKINDIDNNEFDGAAISEDGTQVISDKTIQAPSVTLDQVNVSAVGSKGIVFDLDSASDGSQLTYNDGVVTGEISDFPDPSGFPDGYALIVEDGKWIIDIPRKDLPLATEGTEGYSIQIVNGQAKWAAIRPDVPKASSGNPGQGLLVNASSTGYIIGDVGGGGGTSTGEHNYKLGDTIGTINDSHFIQDGGFLRYKSTGQKVIVLKGQTINLDDYPELKALLGFEDDNFQYNKITSTPLNIIDFAFAISDPNKGICVSENGDYFLTSDGGKTWTEYALQDTYPLLTCDISFDGTTYVIGGTLGRFLISFDGLVFNQYSTGKIGNIISSAFNSTSSTLVLVDNKSNIFTYLNNNFDNKSIFNTGFSEQLNHVKFSSDGLLCIACGDKGLILESTQDTAFIGWEIKNSPSSVDGIGTQLDEFQSVYVKNGITLASNVSKTAQMLISNDGVKTTYSASSDGITFTDLDDSVVVDFKALESTSDTKFNTLIPNGSNADVVNMTVGSTDKSNVVSMLSLTSESTIASNNNQSGSTIFAVDENTVTLADNIITDTSTAPEQVVDISEFGGQQTLITQREKTATLRLGTEIELIATLNDYVIRCLKKLPDGRFIVVANDKVVNSDDSQTGDAFFENYYSGYPYVLILDNTGNITNTLPFPPGNLNSVSLGYYSRIYNSSLANDREGRVPWGIEIKDNLVFIFNSKIDTQDSTGLLTLLDLNTNTFIPYTDLIRPSGELKRLNYGSFNNDKIYQLSATEYGYFSISWRAVNTVNNMDITQIALYIYNKDTSKGSAKEILRYICARDSDGSIPEDLNSIAFGVNILSPSSVTDPTNIELLPINFGNITPRYLTKTQNDLEGCLITFSGSSFGNTRPKDQRTTNMEGMIYSCGFVSNPTDYPRISETPGISYFDLGKTFTIKSSTKISMDAFCEQGAIDDDGNFNPTVDQAYGIFDNGILDIQVIHNNLKSFIIIVPASRIDNNNNTETNDTVSYGGFFFAEWTQAQKDADEFPTEYDFCPSVDTLPLISTASRFELNGVKAGAITGQYEANIPGNTNIIRQNNNEEFYFLCDTNLYPERGAYINILSDSQPAGSPYTLKEFAMNWDCALGSFFFGGIDRTDSLPRKYISKVRFDESGDLIKTGVVTHPALSDLILDSYITTYDIGYINPSLNLVKDNIEVTSAYHANLSGVSLANMDVTDEGLYMTSYDVSEFDHLGVKVQKAINNKIVFIPNSDIPARATNSSILQAGRNIRSNKPVEEGTRGVPLGGAFQVGISFNHQTPEPTQNTLPDNITKTPIDLLENYNTPANTAIVFNGNIVIGGDKQLIVKKDGVYQPITNTDLEDYKGGEITANDTYLFVVLSGSSSGVNNLLVLDTDYNVVNRISTFPNGATAVKKVFGFKDQCIIATFSSGLTVSLLTDVLTPTFVPTDIAGVSVFFDNLNRPFYYSDVDDVLYFLDQEFLDLNLYKSTDNTYLTYTSTAVTVNTNSDIDRLYTSIVYAEGDDICFSFDNTNSSVPARGAVFTSITTPKIISRNTSGDNQEVSNSGLGAISRITDVVKTDDYFVFNVYNGTDSTLGFSTLNILPVTASLTRNRRSQYIDYTDNTFGNYLGGKWSIVESGNIEANPQPLVYVGFNDTTPPYIFGLYKTNNNKVTFLSKEFSKNPTDIGNPTSTVYEYTVDVTPQTTAGSFERYGFGRNTSGVYTEVGKDYIGCHVTEDTFDIFVHEDGSLFTTNGIPIVKGVKPLTKVLKFLEFELNVGIFILAQTETEYVIYTSFDTGYAEFSVNTIILPDDVVVIDAGLDVKNSDNIAPSTLFIQTDKGVYEADILETVPNSDFKFVAHSNNFSFICGTQSTILRRENNNYFTTLFDLLGVQFNAIAAASANDVFVTGEESYKSTDDGLNWVLYNDGIPATKTNIQTTSSTADPSLLLADGRIYRSETGWDNYTQISSEIGNNVQTSTLVRSTNTVFFADEKVVRSQGLNGQFQTIKDAELAGYSCTAIVNVELERDVLANYYIFSNGTDSKTFYTVNAGNTAVSSQDLVFPVFSAISNLKTAFVGSSAGNVYTGEGFTQTLTAGTSNITTMTFSPNLVISEVSDSIITLVVGNDIGELYSATNVTPTFSSVTVPAGVVATSQFISSTSGVYNTIPSTLLRKPSVTDWYAFVTEDSGTGDTQLVFGELGSFSVKDDFTEKIYCTRIQDDPNFVIVVSGGDTEGFISYSTDGFTWNILDIPFVLKPIKAFEINKNVLVGCDVSGEIFSVRFYPNLSQYTIANSIYHGRENLRYIFAETNKNPISNWQTINVSISGYTRGQINSSVIAYYGIGDITVVDNTGAVSIVSNPSSNEISYLEKTGKYYGYLNGDVLLPDGTLYFNYGSSIQSLCIFKEILFVSTVDGKFYQEQTEIINPFDTFVGSNIITAIDSNDSMLVLCNSKMNIATSSTIGIFDVVYKDNPALTPLNDIAFIDEKVFVCGNEGVILVGDISSFDLKTTGLTDNVTAITSLNGNLFCLDSNNKIISSRDEFLSNGNIETLLLEDVASNSLDIGVINNNVVATATDSNLNVKIIITTSD